MANLLGSLTNAALALSAQQAGVQTAGRNLANANDPTYARQRVNLGDRNVIETPDGPQGTGVELLGVEQIRDRFLDDAVTQETSRSSFLSAQQNALLRAETSLGSTVDRSADATALGDTGTVVNGINSSVTDFFNSWEGLSADPTGSGAQQTVQQKAQTLADKLNTADQRLSGLQDDLTTLVTDGVDQANSMLKQVASLNGEIAKLEVQAPGSALDLRDDRQAVLEKLAANFDFTSQPLAGKPGQIEVLARDASGGTFALVQGTVVRGGVSFDGTNLNGGNPPVALNFQAGAIAANLGVRDGAVAGLRSDLRNVATQLATAVNGVYSATGNNFFKTPPTSGLLTVDPSVATAGVKATATASAGSNELALAIGALHDQAFTTAGGATINGTITDVLRSKISGLSAQASTAVEHSSDQATVQQMVTAQRDSLSGVSQDEDMADLIKFQRAYEASARVVRTLDDLLDTLVNLGR